MEAFQQTPYVHKQKLFKFEPNRGKEAATQHLFTPPPLLHLPNHLPLHLIGIADQNMEEHGSRAAMTPLSLPRISLAPLPPTCVRSSSSTKPGPPGKPLLPELPLSRPGPPYPKP